MNAWIAENKTKNKLLMRPLMSAGHLVYCLKGPIGTRFYEAGRYTREEARRDYLAQMRG